MKIVEKCNNEDNIDMKIRIFFDLNDALPDRYKVKIPSLITNDYINFVLYKVESILNEL